MNVLVIGREAVLPLQGQEVVGVGLPLIVVMVRGMVMLLALRNGLAAVGHCPDEVDVDDGRWTKSSKVRYIWVVQYGLLSTGQKTFFSAAATSSNHTFSIWFMVFRGKAMDQSLMFSAKRAFLSVTPPNDFCAYSFDKSVGLQ